MPAFVIFPAGRPYRPGEEIISATLSDPGPSGYPDSRSAVSVKVKLINERTLSVDGVNRAIISCEILNGVTRYLVDGSTQALRNCERRVALARALAHLRQLGDIIMPLKPESERPELITESLGMLFDWFAVEDERLSGGGRTASR
jgi:hypothetical protein